MKFVVEGEPIAQKRHRHVFRRGTPHSYDPQTKEKKFVRYQLKRQLDEALNNQDPEIVKEASNLTSNCAFHVYLTFYMPIRESEPNSKRMAKLWNVENHISKPDLDNLEKFYLDCGSGILFPDDRFINAIGKRKTYSENPRTEIEIQFEDNMLLDEEVKALIETFTPGELKKLANLCQILYYPGDDEMPASEKRGYLLDYTVNLKDILNSFGPQLAKFSKRIKTLKETK
jgi:Holliday junction resolvase RusA-like endonuclease